MYFCNFVIDIWIPFTQVCFIMKSSSPKYISIWVQNSQAKRKTTNKKQTLTQECLLCPVLLKFGKGLGPSFEQTWSLFTQGCFVLSCLEIGLEVLEKKILISSMYFCCFITISSLVRVWAFISSNLNPLLLNDALC